MVISSYTKKVPWKRGKCSVCGKIRWLCQHHIDRRKNSDKVIWVCSNGNPNGVMYTDSCHAKIHNPTAFGLSASWAYDNGYLRRLDSTYRRKKRNPDKWKIKK